MNGIYDSTIDDILSNYTAHMDWLTRNKINPLGWDYNTVYASNAEVNDSRFDDMVLDLYLRKIKVGIAWSSQSEVDNAIAYNARQTDYRKKLSHMVSELETYGNANCTVAQYRDFLKNNYPKINAAGMKSYVYDGWNYNFDISVPYSDGILLHAYRTAIQMLIKDDAWDYWVKAGNDRLIGITAAAKAAGKIFEVSLLTSCEPSFGQMYYATHGWNDELTMIKDSFYRLATPDMKQWLIIDGQYIFKASDMKISKP
jgi:hypothetical protein